MWYGRGWLRSRLMHHASRARLPRARRCEGVGGRCLERASLTAQNSLEKRSCASKARARVLLELTREVLLCKYGVREDQLTTHNSL